MKTSISKTPFKAPRFFETKMGRLSLILIVAGLFAFVGSVQAYLGVYRVQSWGEMRFLFVGCWLGPMMVATAPFDMGRRVRFAIMIPAAIWSIGLMLGGYYSGMFQAMLPMGIKAIAIIGGAAFVPGILVGSACYWFFWRK